MMALEAAGLAVPGRLEPCDLALPPGCLAAVVGPNGAGKSTLLQALAGLLPARGEVRWHGEALPRIPALDRGRRLAWVPQEAHAEFAFPVREVVAQGRFAHGDDGQGVAEALAALDIAHLAERPITRLSGGERSRTFLARALATGAKLHLWDEPLAQLDVRHALEVLHLAKRLAGGGATLLVSIHDLRVALCMDRVLLLDRGSLAAAGPPDAVLTPDAIARVFGVRARLDQSLILELP
jgi:iron complex transport system ATP-binding protein